MKARKDHCPLTANSAEEHNSKVTVLFVFYICPSDSMSVNDPDIPTEVTVQPKRVSVGQSSAKPKQLRIIWFMHVTFHT